MNKVCDHFCHSLILFAILYMGMKFLLKQNSDKACIRSALIASLAFIYMIMFNHSFPPRGLNPYLKFF
jgi:hypothetical protein